MALRAVVVGAGPAGCSAALTLLKQGCSVSLVDEHPLTTAAVAADTPYFFGARLVPGLEHRGRMLERMLESNPALQQVWDAGAEVLLGTSVWGSFRPGENSSHLTQPCLGLADAERSWTLGYDRLILATGARDLVLSFPGWELPGVMGAQAAHALLARYGAFTGRRLAILGSGTLALGTAELALSVGVEVAALVEVEDRVQGDATRAAELGIPVFTGHCVLAAQGTTEVNALAIVGVDDNLQPVAGSERRISCDTVCLALDGVPSIELASLSGCHLTFDGPRGGWVPQRDGRLETTVPGIFVAGDAGGILWDRALAEVEGIRAGLAAADASLSGEAPVRPALDGGSARWLKAQVICSGEEVFACLCEEVSRGELLGVSAPRYLGATAARGLRSLAAAPPHPDVLKRLTRAGMGHCQGRRCREQVALLLADAGGVELSAIPCASYRPPIRPIPLRVLQSEADEPGQPWSMWFHAVQR